MEERNECGCLSVLAFEAMLSLVMWVVLIILKAFNAIYMHWALVLSGILWISWALFLLTAIVAGAVTLATRIKAEYRQRKIDRRVRTKMDQLGLWAMPQVLGGRALDIYAWDQLRIKRKPGEGDADLRHRCAETRAENIRILNNAKKPPAGGMHNV